MTQITFLGHATVLVAMDDARLLTDPVLRRRVGHLRRRERVDPTALGDIDSVLVSHVHHDHLDLPSLESLGRETTILVPRGAGTLLRRRAFGRVVEMDTGDRIMVGAVAAQAVHAEHEGVRWPFGPRAPSLGYLLVGSHRVYFAGDTDLFDDMASLSPGLDVALVPIWGWGPGLGRGKHLDPEGAAKALSLLRPRIAVPIHWGTYHPLHLGLRNVPAFLRDPPERFLRAAAERAPDVDVRILQPGETLEI